MKYIIDIPKEYISKSSLLGEILSVPIQIDGGKNYNIPTAIKITPYNGQDRKAIEDAQEEVWEFAKTVSIMKPEDKCELWGTSKYNTINLGYSYAEAKARYDAWKAESEQIRVGDECLDEDGDKCVVVFGTDRDICDVIYDDGSTDEIHKDFLKKTGKHYDYIEKLLKKMKEE